MKEKKIVALFDFDGTITYSSSSLAYLRYVSGYKYYVYFVLIFPVLILFILKLINIDQLNVFLCSLCLKGYSRSELCAKGHTFLQEKMPGLLKTKALACLKRHQSKGHYCILATAAYDVYIKEWGHDLHFDQVLCTKLLFDEQGKATGKLNGQSCSGAEKLRQIKTLVNKDDFEIYAYGDSSGDKEMLAFSDYPHYKFFNS